MSLTASTASVALNPETVKLDVIAMAAESAFESTA